MDIPRNIRKLVDGVVGGQGHAPKETRKAAFAGDPAALEEPLRSYVAKIANHAYKIVDRDLEALRMAGYNDDQIFEITICSAVGAGFLRLERGLAALKDA